MVDSIDIEEAGWPALYEDDVDADLLDVENAEIPFAPLQLEPQSTEDDLRQLKRQHETMPGFDVDVFFKAHSALLGISADLQGALMEVEDLQFASAKLVALLAHGPLKAPSASNRLARSVQELFGPLSAPKAPPDLVAELPSRASNLVSYQHRLAALPRSLFVTKSIPLCVGNVNQYQDSKDINRDELLVNGLHISGASGGYSAAVTAIADSLRAASCDEGGQEWNGNAEELAAQLLLSILNRTTSGFLLFNEILRLFDCEEVVNVAPESAAAKPLEALVLGGIALGRAHIPYKVVRSDLSGGPLARIDAFFTFRICTSMLNSLTSRVPNSEDNEGWPIEMLPAAVLLQIV